MGNCKKEAYQLASSGKVSLPGQGKSGDCIHDSLQKYSVDLKSVQYDSSSDSIELSVHKIVSIKVKLSKNSLSMEYDRAKFKKASLMANPAIECLKSKCSSQYSSCQGDSVCKSVMSCVEPCSDSSCALKCVKPHILNPKVASLGACGGKNGCWSSTAEETFPMAVPSGTYKGTTKELGVTVKATITIDDTSHADIAVVASGIVSVNVNCKKESYQLASSGKVSLPGQGKSGDCIHDSLQKYSVDLKSVQYDSSSDSIELSVHKIVSIKVKLSKNSLSMEYDRAKFKKASLMANPAIACLKSKCSSQYSSCQGDSVCKSVVSCVEPCSDSSCALKCVKPHIFNPKVASLGACGGKNGCWSSTAEETFPMAVPSGTYK